MVTENCSYISVDASIEPFNNHRNYPKRKLIWCFLKLSLYSDNEQHIPPKSPLVVPLKHLLVMEEKLFRLQKLETECKVCWYDPELFS